jgi:hypothetical protein
MESIVEVAEIAQDKLDRENAKNIAIQTVLAIVHDFLTTNKVMCYGGTAINNLLPKKERFYDPERDVPDYDFFSLSPQLHAMELADKIAAAGYKIVEVKPGMHLGTFKVYADYTGVADITYLEPEIFERLWDDSIEKEGIRYVPPNFLRMSVYLELSRPRGDVSRWKKVYSRILLLNNHYPILCPAKYEETTERLVSDSVRKKIERAIVDENAILLGFNASTLQQKGSGKWKLPLDLLVTQEKRDETARVFHQILSDEGKTTLRTSEGFGEILPPFTDIIDSEKKVLVRIYETNACHSYHTTASGLRIASIPTLLQFFLSTMYGDDVVRESIPEQRYLCAAENLIQMANDDLPRRYKLLTPIECLGKQDSIVDIRVRKANVYEKASKNKNSTDFLRHFFAYVPGKLSGNEKKKLVHKLKNLTEDHSD